MAARKGRLIAQSSATHLLTAFAIILAIALAVIYLDLRRLKRALNIIATTHQEAFESILTRLRATEDFLWVIINAFPETRAGRDAEIRSLSDEAARFVEATRTRLGLDENGNPLPPEPPSPTPQEPPR